MADVYNPLDKLNLGKSVAKALLEQPVTHLRSIERFEGAGIYALYYSGAHPAYRSISLANAEAFQWPIYVGKAIPAGGRKGASLKASARGTALFARLVEHRESIRAVGDATESLLLDDFHVRFLVVDDIWIPLGESLLIAEFKPVWNVKLDGFGNHDPGKGRYKGLRPLWDHLHPGRPWASRCAARPEKEDEVRADLLAYLSAHPIAQ